MPPTHRTSELRCATDSGRGPWGVPSRDGCSKASLHSKSGQRCGSPRWGNPAGAHQNSPSRPRERSTFRRPQSRPFRSCMHLHRCSRRSTTVLHPAPAPHGCCLRQMARVQSIPRWASAPQGSPRWLQRPNRHGRRTNWNRCTLGRNGFHRSGFCHQNGLRCAPQWRIGWRWCPRVGSRCSARLS